MGRVKVTLAFNTYLCGRTCMCLEPATKQVKDKQALRRQRHDGNGLMEESLRGRQIPDIYINQSTMMVQVSTLMGHNAPCSRGVIQSQLSSSRNMFHSPGSHLHSCLKHKNRTLRRKTQNRHRRLHWRANICRLPD